MLTASARIGSGWAAWTFSVPSRSELEKALVLCKLRGAEPAARSWIVARPSASTTSSSTTLDGIPIELFGPLPARLIGATHAAPKWVNPPMRR